MLAMIIEKTKLRNDREFKNEPEPPQMAPKGKMVFNLPYEKARLYVVGKRIAERQKVDKRYEICYK